MMTVAATSDAAPPVRRIWAYRHLLLIAAAVLAADQLTKHWIVHRLPFNTYTEADGAIPVVRGFLYIVHVGNTGAAWSMFSGFGIFLAALAAATLVAIFCYRRVLGLREPGIQVAFGLLCGGIVGNLIDRCVRHHVVDFLDFHFGSYVYPTFNVADCGICVGVGLYLLRSLRSPTPRSPSAP